MRAAKIRQEIFHQFKESLHKYAVEMVQPYIILFYARTDECFPNIYTKKEEQLLLENVFRELNDFCEEEYGVEITLPHKRLEGANHFRFLSEIFDYYVSQVFYELDIVEEEEDFNL
ncbi:hypothetical protein [Neobacillus niacini]|uniref:hypothetical protein n=1 Tax=Neobacillus niacini TaxID=86668 RepID=UPI002041A413|nr:hypothetical protein [Neobacillus niacini]MCM3692202.1 hypothetical protein [Neobacillus niacini]